MAQIRIELGLVLKYVRRGAEKVNALNYLTKLPPPLDEYYYEEESYVVNDQMGFLPKVNALIRRIGAKVKEIKVGTMVITTERVIMFDMGITTAITMVK